MVDESPAGSKAEIAAEVGERIDAGVVELEGAEIIGGREGRIHYAENWDWLYETAAAIAPFTVLPASMIVGLEDDFFLAGKLGKSAGEDAEEEQVGRDVACRAKGVDAMAREFRDCSKSGSFDAAGSSKTGGPSKPWSLRAQTLVSPVVGLPLSIYGAKRFRSELAL